MSTEQAESNTYSINHLVNRVYNMLGQHEAAKKLKLVKPDVGRQSKKTVINNFKEVCEAIHRDKQEVMDYFKSELATEANFSGVGNSKLLIAGIFKQNGIQNVLGKYITRFVLCRECNSYRTSHVRENRIRFMECSDCKTRYCLENL